MRIRCLPAEIYGRIKKDEIPTAKVLHPPFVQVNNFQKDSSVYILSKNLNRNSI